MQFKTGFNYETFRDTKISAVSLMLAGSANNLIQQHKYTQLFHFNAPDPQEKDITEVFCMMLTCLRQLLAG